MNYNSDLDNIQLNKVAPNYNERTGKVTDFTCPKCNNTLWEFEDEYLPYFRCDLGHIYSPKSLLTEQITRLKKAFWQEVRLLEVRAPKEKSPRLTQ
jgi:two-component system chemotaxis response regulator CheB